MITIAELWLPILLSAVLVFVASSIFHMVIQMHSKDYKKMSGEDAVLEAIRGQNLRPGTYMFPGADSLKAAYTPEMIEKWKRGPVGIMTVMPSGPPNMGKNLSLWFLYTILIGVFVAYAGTLGLQRGDEYMSVFRLTGTVAILGYALSAIPETIWKGQSWATTARFIFDGVVYGLVTAGTFGWLWPAAA